MASLLERFGGAKQPQNPNLLAALMQRAGQMPPQAMGSAGMAAQAPGTLAPTGMPAMEARQPPSFMDRMRGGLSDNSNMLLGISHGLLNNGIEGVPQGAMMGRGVDMERQAAGAEQEEQQQSRNATAALLRQYNPQMSEDEALQHVRAGSSSTLLSQALTPQRGGGPFTLAPGQVRYDGQGNEVARGGEDPADAQEQRDQAIIQSRAREDARTAIRLASELESNEALPSAVGSFEGGLPSYLTTAGLPGGTTPQDVDDFRAGVERLGGQAFMQAREALKGGGQITDYEGQRAEAALVNLNASQSAEAYQRELRNFQVAIARGMILLEGQEPTPESVEAFIGEMTSGTDAPGAADIGSQAQDAIQRGADPTRVAERLREAGLNPEDYGITAPQAIQTPGSLPPDYFQRGGA